MEASGIQLQSMRETHGEGAPTGFHCECGGKIYRWKVWGYDVNDGRVDEKYLECEDCHKRFDELPLNSRIDKLRRDIARLIWDE